MFYLQTHLQTQYFWKTNATAVFLKLHWHLHAFCPHNCTQCHFCGTQRGVNVAWRRVCALFARCTRILRTVHAMREQNDRNRHAVERLVYAYFELSLRTSTHCPDDFTHAWIRRGISSVLGHAFQHAMFHTQLDSFNMLNTRDNVVAEQRCLSGCGRTIASRGGGETAAWATAWSWDRRRDNSIYKKKTTDSDGLGDGWLEDMSSDITISYWQNSTRNIAEAIRIIKELHLICYKRWWRS